MATAITRPERPRPGMYLLDEDLAMDATKRMAVQTDSEAARFVLGSAGSEVPVAVVDRLTNVEIEDRHVRLAKKQPKAEPESTGPVEATPDRGSTMQEGEPFSTADLDRGEAPEPPAEPKTDAKKAEKKDK